MVPACPSPALGILLTQGKTDEVIHNQLQVRGRQEAWKKNRRGILSSAKGCSGHHPFPSSRLIAMQQDSKHQRYEAPSKNRQERD